MFIDDVIRANRFRPRESVHRRSLGRLLGAQLVVLASLLQCKVSDLRLDHDPALGARKRRGEGKKTVYSPPANDPDYLRYRPHGPEFEGSHLIKTNVRGEHGQYPDRVLIKRERRRREGKRMKPKRKWASRPFPKGRKLRNHAYPVDAYRY